MGKLATTRRSICYHPSQYLPYPHRRYCDDSWEALERPVADTATTNRRHSLNNGKKGGIPFPILLNLLVTIEELSI